MNKETTEHKLQRIEGLRDVITKKLQKEFNPTEVIALNEMINDLIELEIEVEQECNQ